MVGIFTSNRKIPFRKYFDNGTPRILGYHCDESGRKTGKWETFYNDGSLRDVGYYDDDVKCGKWAFYNKYGRLKSTGNYKNNKQDGKWKFYKAGKLESVGYYKEGIPHGEWHYYENGTLDSIGHYYKGQQSGEWSWYHWNSALKEVVNYENNTKHGDSKFYSEDGKLIIIKTYESKA